MIMEMRLALLYGITVKQLNQRVKYSRGGEEFLNRTKAARSRQHHRCPSFHERSFLPGNS